MQIPVYLFTGFLESGKTTFIIDTLKDPNFSEGEKTLVICCEEGETEYEEELLNETNSVIEYVDEPETLSTEYFEALQKKHKPKQVVIEYNGTWSMDKILDITLPKKWVCAEILSTADAQTFEAYMNNMRSILMDQFSQSDVLIFNRCTDETPKALYARTIKANNRRIKFIFENVDGEIDNDFEEELPYDINQPHLEIEDDDYGIWYIDAMEHPENYEGKTVSFTAMVYKDRKLGDKSFVPGRHVMTCCADDVAFLGFLCRYENSKNLKLKQWIHIEAEIKIEKVKEYGGDGPVLYPKLIENAQEPEEVLLSL